MLPDLFSKSKAETDYVSFFLEKSALLNYKLYFRHIFFGLSFTGLLFLFDLSVIEFLSIFLFFVKLFFSKLRAVFILLEKDF